MNIIHFLDIKMLFLFWAIPFLALLYIYAERKRKKALNLFAGSHLHHIISVSISLSKRRAKSAVILLAFFFGVIAAARPAWNPVPQKIKSKGRDLVFILDVSKSMLAEDLSPNRLERAKLAIKDVIDTLRGDRVGLIVFSGNAVIKCPLTLDYGFFRMMLDAVSTDSVSRGGTMIGDALRKAVNEVFSDMGKKYKDIILITDGEDHDSFPVEAASYAGEKGVRLIAIGIGDEEQGQRIPVTDKSGRTTFLKYKGHEVWSRLDGDTLRKMVNATPGGRYLNVATGTINLDEVYIKLVASAEKKALEAKTIIRYEDKFQIFAGTMFLFLILDMILGERKQY